MRTWRKFVISSTTCCMTVRRGFPEKKHCEPWRLQSLQRTRYCNAGRVRWRWRPRWQRSNKFSRRPVLRCRNPEPAWEVSMSGTTGVAYKSPLHEMTQSTPTCLWNDSASIQELTYSIEHGAVGATCNPVIVLGVLKKEMPQWKDRIQALIQERPTATEDEISWQLAREISVK